MTQYRNRLTQKFRGNASFWLIGVVSDPENAGMSIPDYAFAATISLWPK